MAQITRVLVLLSVIVAVALASQPNLLLILTDDQDYELGSLDFMPKVKKHLTDRGVFFERFYVNTALCCPSRATLLRGQFCHNTNVTNLAEPWGGAHKYLRLNLYQDDLATWLQNAGYHTAHIGKFLNGYNMQDINHPGFTTWLPLVDPGQYDYYNSTFKFPGNLYKNFPGVHQVDVITNLTLTVMAQAAIEEQKPFFIQVASVATHQSWQQPGSWVPPPEHCPLRKPDGTIGCHPVPAHRHADAFPDLKAPRPPSYNESDETQNLRPSFLKNFPTFNEEQAEAADLFYRDRIRTLLSVDEMVETFVKFLEEKNLLDNTIIMYTSDNGYHIGEHRMNGGKREAYEEDIHVPFIIRGPRIPHGVVLNDVLGSNVDIAPTFADFAGVTVPDWVDGRSLVPVVSKTKKSSEQTDSSDDSTLQPASRIGVQSRQLTYVEHYGESEPNYIWGGTYWNNSYQAIRVRNNTDDWLYVEWCTNEGELYNHAEDPHQVHNLFYLEEQQQRVSWFSNILHHMRVCKGESCRFWEQAGGLHFQELMQSLTADQLASFESGFSEETLKCQPPPQVHFSDFYQVNPKFEIEMVIE
jgi:N-acetylglucosamine-6-sulfatase